MSYQPAPVSRLGQTRDLTERLYQRQLLIDYGACSVRIGSSVAELADGLVAVYQGYPVVAETPSFADFHVDVCRTGGLRRFWRPQARFVIDGIEPFEPFAARLALPLFEWGVNWCFGQRFNQYVLLHAGALALGDAGVIMAAPPGFGKSTLTAAMMLSGFRLLSDEFGVLVPGSGALLPMLKPVALKNASIDVIRERDTGNSLGPRFIGTRKGDVAHLPPSTESLDARRQAVRPRLVLFPAYVAGRGVEIEAEEKHEAFARLAFNSFNYHVLGSGAFHALGDVVERCPCYRITYGDLDQAIAAVRELLSDAACECPAPDGGSCA